MDIFLVENMRTARRYISSLKTGLVIEELRFEILDKKTSDQQLSAYMSDIKKGLNAAVISESGCPGIADPGARMVALAHKNSIPVYPLSGPSSILLGLMGSGMNGQAFTFHGYLPIDRNARALSLRKLNQQVTQGTQIFIETPYRNKQMFEAILEHCNAKTLLCVAYDLTGKKQFIETRPVEQWKGRTPDFHKIPCIFLLGS
jgi:16S rRNA (cytidine1402-2'-O)-methyltransferase